MQGKRIFTGLRRDCVVSSILIFILLVSIPGIVLAVRKELQSGQHVEGNIRTFTPQPLALSSPEVTNPWRGAYEWYDNNLVPDWPSVDSYTRYNWRQIEPTEGQYDFALIDKELASAQAHQGKFGFRIMPAGVDNIAVPDYLTALMPHGGWFINSYSGKRAYEPDWNDPNYIARAIALINALGQRYNNDARLGWVDMFPYGDWGEWHTSGFPNTIPPMTEANQQLLITTMLHAFSNKRIVMFAEDPASLSYALHLSPQIGIRIDCLGTSDLGGVADKLQQVPFALNRWKTAPLIFEFCQHANPQIALSDVATYHGAMVSNGNLFPFSSYSLEQQGYLERIFSDAGYRFILDSMRLPSRLVPNTTFTISSEWSNVNVTPAYNAWNVMIQLRNSVGKIVWQGKSGLDLQSLLPTVNQTTSIDTPVTVLDHFTLPGTIAPGSYHVSIQILDPHKYYKPLQIAIKGRNSDGSYSLGTVTIADVL